MSTARPLVVAALASALCLPSRARADDPPPLRVSGYVEAFYQWNFNAPANGATNLRGFDDRHNAFTLGNAVIDARWDWRRVVGRLALQVGRTPDVYYAAEPVLAASGTSAASGPDAWKHLQQANVGYRFDVGRGLTVSAGLFLSPIGVEAMAVRENWSWSRSDLFFGLPFYHAGARASLPVSARWELSLAVFNGWNSLLDNNDEKTVAAGATYTSDALTASALYMSGVERPPGAPEGRAWRHLVDLHATWRALPWLWLRAHANVGAEPNDLGLSAWAAGAIYLRARLRPTVFVAARGDFFYERAPDGASRLFWPVDWVSSATATLEWRPSEHLSARLEYRHDQASGDVYFANDASGMAGAPSRPSQDTLTLGLTAWLGADP